RALRQVASLATRSLRREVDLLAVPPEPHRHGVWPAPFTRRRNPDLPHAAQTPIDPFPGQMATCSTPAVHRLRSRASRSLRCLGHAGERTRTSTGHAPPGPNPGASTSSATPALGHTR